MTGPAQPVVHLVAKTHLDIGFTALAAEVVDGYVDVFIPAALDVAEQLRADGGDERFVWTTGSWLIDTYLEQADATGRARMEAAIEAGDIAWHALPFTLHSELCDRSLFEHGLSISARLDARFGRTTIAAKMTDVPGHTRGIVPLLAAAGVELLHIGVNPACPAPAVPPVFRWRSSDGSEVVVAYQEGGYGGAVSVDGLADSLVVAHTDDNKGPQTVDQVHEVFARVRADHPDAAVRASTLDAFAVALRSVRDTLPVVTQELGDTWIHGVGTDPQKVARFRELSRLRAGWIESGAAMADELADASTKLLLVAEHTWGLDEKITLEGDHRYRADELTLIRRSPAGRRFEASWAEQRRYVDRAVALLPERLRAEAEDALAAIEPSVIESDLDDRWLPLDRPMVMSIGELSMEVDQATGALSALVGPDDRDWAGADHPLGRFRYQTFDQHDYDRFHAGYNQARPDDEWWAIEDYTKPGIDESGAISRWWDPERVWLLPARGGFDLRLIMPTVAHERFGCPAHVTVGWRQGHAPDRFDVTVAWSAKPASRLPEASWFSFVPHVDDGADWTIDKLGQPVSPLDVVPRGGRHLHAVGDGGLAVTDGDRTLRVTTWDAPLVAPGRPALLDGGDELPDLTGGFHVNLHNNVWGTNFPMWNEGAAQFRFTVEL